MAKLCRKTPREKLLLRKSKGKMKETFSAKTGVFKSVILRKNETFGFWSKTMPETEQRKLKKLANFCRKQPREIFLLRKSKGK